MLDVQQVPGLFISISTVKHRVHGIFWMQILHWVLNKHHLISLVKSCEFHTCSNFIEEKMRSKDISDLFKVTQLKWFEEEESRYSHSEPSALKAQTMEQHVFSLGICKLLSEVGHLEMETQVYISWAHKAKNFISAWRYSSRDINPWEKIKKKKKKTGSFSNERTALCLCDRK